MPTRREQSGIFPAPSLVRRRRALARRGHEQGRYSEVVAELGISLARHALDGRDGASWTAFVDDLAPRIERELAIRPAKRGDDEPA